MMEFGLSLEVKTFVMLFLNAFMVVFCSFTAVLLVFYLFRNRNEIFSRQRSPAVDLAIGVFVIFIFLVIDRYNVITYVRSAMVKYMPASDAEFFRLASIRLGTTVGAWCTARVIGSIVWGPLAWVWMGLAAAPVALYLALR